MLSQACPGRINGRRGESTTLEELKSELEHDLYYIDNRSFMLDLKILLRAISQDRLL
jgi:lipopolysaccharide/colanic/teichoic acid biosynthesis glycosyltransferase